MQAISDEKIFSIQLKGALDGASSEDLLSYIEAQLEAGYTRFLFNFSFVQFITSNGISTLIKIQNRMKQSPELSFVFYGLTEEVENVLLLLGMYKKLPIQKSLLEAESFLRRATTNRPMNIEKVEIARDSFPPKSPTDRIRFYYTGSPKEPVSKLEKITSVEVTETISEKPQETIRETEPIEIPAMERLLEDKLSLLRKEIKDTLSSELEKRLTVSIRSTTNTISEPDTGVIPSYVQAKSKKNMEAPFQKIFPCEACGKKLRVTQVGLHKCPNCNTEVFVNASGPTRFIEKLDF